jgi:hypothetical protein
MRYLLLILIYVRNTWFGAFTKKYLKSILDSKLILNVENFKMCG